ncbi:OmpH family outer membrane protein [Brevundimonas nasdae]|uniref:OmpH family outer membrane protein n=1 Tax=Brevundimonas nasdae TaxID=172043 RepID=A0ABX8THI5_9CAUL|nr:OmpH family outer membrane protein [Brevundimonas nasdae]QYC10702.1 OmpH family outer membrane protein [Brevundimonas nasdae]QYC13489.1 OmpH family outer membrane protein [Brevundimonas nasdae]
MISRILLSAAVIVAMPAVASAQTIGGARQAVTPAPAQSQSLGGPVIPGVCLLSREAVFANAAVGRVATARLAELTQAAQAEIDAERAPIEAAARALEGQPETDQLRAQAQTLSQQWQALQQKATHNGQEIEATRMVVMERIANEAQPIIAQVYAEHQCGLLFDRASALGGNFANDLTAGVVTALDARISTISFDREPLSTAPAAAASSAPATQAPARRR